MTADWNAMTTPDSVLVANLPYNVATPLVADLLDGVPNISRLLVMVQREVAERLAARPRTPAYGAVSVKVAYWGVARIVGHVPASVFVPRPNVESALVEITRRRAAGHRSDQVVRARATGLRAPAEDVASVARRRRHARAVRRRRRRADRATGRARRRRLVPAHRGGPRELGPVTVRVLAPAKLTWSLRVVGVRDDGYHLIDAEMVTLDLADELTIDADVPAGLSVSGPFSDGVPTDESNLVMKALRLAGREAAVHVAKRIPSGGGLGGGSADAAAILRWAGVVDPRSRSAWAPTSRSVSPAAERG